MGLLVATGNPGKLAEFRDLLRGVDVLSPDEAGVAGLDVDETGDTFHENAALKAAAYCQAAGTISVADDSGLEVDALDGRPGVQSARYGGPELDDEGRYRRLLDELQGVPTPERSARFRCCLVAIAPDGRTVTAAGSCEGHILTAPEGDGGFGYDPVFHVPQYGRSMARLSPDEKGAVSHRGQALRALLPELRRVFPELFEAS